MTESSSSPVKPGTRVVIRFARQAGLLALFVVAALLGTLGGVLFAYADDLPQISALDDYRPTPSPGCWRATDSRSASSPPSAASSFATTTSRPRCARRSSPPRTRTSSSTSASACRASSSRRFKRHPAPGSACRREHDHAAARARCCSSSDYMRGGVFARSGTEGLERKIKEWLVVDPAREALHEARDLRASTPTRSPSATARTASKPASRLYFDKSAKDLTLEEAATIAAIIQTPGAPEPVRQSRAHARSPQQLRPAAHGRRGIHHDGGGRRGRSKRPLVLQGQPRREPRRSRPTSSKRSARCSSRSTAPTRSTRPACACRRRSTRSCRRRPNVARRSRPAAARQAADRLSQAGAQRRRRRQRHRDSFTARALVAGRSSPATSFRPS